MLQLQLMQLQLVLLVVLVQHCMGHGWWHGWLGWWHGWLLGLKGQHIGGAGCWLGWWQHMLPQGLVVRGAALALPVACLLAVLAAVAAAAAASGSRSSRQ